MVEVESKTRNSILESKTVLLGATMAYTSHRTNHRTSRLTKPFNVRIQIFQHKISTPSRWNFRILKTDSYRAQLVVCTVACMMNYYTTTTTTLFTVTPSSTILASCSLELNLASSFSTNMMEFRPICRRILLFPSIRHLHGNKILKFPRGCPDIAVAISKPLKLVGGPLTSRRTSCHTHHATHTIVQAPFKSPNSKFSIQHFNTFPLEF